jgi:homoserine O-succinyltransferase
LQFRYHQRRQPLPAKCWGVYPHHVVERTHPLVSDVNTRFDVPHSRFNDISRTQFDAAGLHVLTESDDAGVHLAVSPDGFRQVFFQGHPEYDMISLLKEYQREIKRFIAGIRIDYPPFPDHYFGLQARAILDEHRGQVHEALDQGRDVPAFPEQWMTARLHNTWHDTAQGVIGNWMGLVYRVTNHDRRLPFMAEVNPDDPLGLGWNKR